MPELSPLEKLRVADPETCAWFLERLRGMQPPAAEILDAMVDEIIWALAQETGFGRAYADGLLQVGSRMPAGLGAYGELVREAARTGETLAQIIARHAAPVMIAGEGLPERFVQTVALMRAKGTYTLNAPLAALRLLLEAGDRDSAVAYLDLLGTVFRQPMTYNLSLRLTYLLPDAVRAFAPRRRRLQIVQMDRLAQVDLQLLDPYLDGLPRGLSRLNEAGLKCFVGEAIARFARHAAGGSSFLSLASESGRARCVDLQVAVALEEVAAGLQHYVHARLGRRVPVRACSPMASAGDPSAGLVCSDGEAIYLAPELDAFGSRAENQLLYKTLVRLEAGLLEIDTYAFDLERAADRHPEVAAQLGGSVPVSDGCCDAEQFIRSFACPALADDLFTILEQARLMRWLSRAYPGLGRRILPLLARDVHPNAEGAGGHPLRALYAQQVLSMAPQETSLTAALSAALRGDAADVEAVAAAVCRVYAVVAGSAAAPYTPLALPFGWRLQWARVGAAQQAHQRMVERLRAALMQKGLRLYRSDLRRRLAAQGGTLAPGDIRALLRQPGGASANAPVDWGKLDLSALLEASGATPEPADGGAPFRRYPEWDHRLQDYLRDHVTVLMKSTPEASGDLYHHILASRRGLLAHTRRAFELLRPERLKRLRPWREGEEFDYRALLDFAVDRHMGRTPSDRLYIKRIKQERDVAVLLLVDLSRSTANPAAGGGGTVLQVTQEALVIFCEALRVVGDQFAIAGFSGSGRHAVEYLTIKAFDEILDGSVPRRIAALRPRRSTRMGAAIRHAAAELAYIAARVRVLLLISDGFPNDLDYKAEYAVADTRRAIQEARARSIHVKAITVNIGSDPRLDDLYGRRHHHVINAVPELPGKLLGLYGSLTRH